MRISTRPRSRPPLVGLVLVLALGAVGCSGGSGTQATVEEAVVKSQQHSAELKKEQAKLRKEQAKSKVKSKSGGLPGD